MRRKYPDWPKLEELLRHQGLDPEKGATLEQQAANVAAQLPLDTEKSLNSMDEEAIQEYCLESFLDEHRPEL